MTSRAGRKRRSRAYTVRATMPSTTISPKVSKPRKSTSITLTTLVPPLAQCPLQEEGGGAFREGRLIMASASTVMPPPAAMARAMSRQRRSRVRRSCACEGAQIFVTLR